STSAAISIVHTGGGDLEIAINNNVDLTSSAGNGIDLDGSAAAGTLTVTSFADNSVHQDTFGDGVTADTVTFSDGGGAVSGATLRIGVNGDGVGGRGLVLDQVLGGLGFSDLDIEASGGSALTVGNAGQSVGDFGLTTASGTLSAIGGAGLDLDPVTVGLILDAVTSTNSASQGIRLNDVEGMLVIAGGAIVNSTAEAFLLDQDTVVGGLVATYSGSITNTVNRLLHVDGFPVGTLTLNGSTLTDSGTGIRLNDVDGVVNVIAASTTITNGSGNGVLIQGDSDGSLRLDNVAITNGALTAIQIDGGNVASGTFDFNNVDVTYETDAQRMVSIQGLANGASVDFDGASALAATDGTGILVTGNGGTSVVDFNGPVDLGTSGNRISDGVAFQMTANTGGVTVAAADVDIFTSGQTAALASGAGTLDLDTLSIDSLNGAGTSLTGILSQVDVDAISCVHSSNCVDLTSLAAGSTTTFAGVGLTCTGGNCFNANGARTVEVTGAANTIVATNAVGVSLVTTTIGANNVTFRSIASTNAASGILLSSTGSTGSFNVTGTGSADSGGIISGVTEGVSLTSADNVSLTQMAIVNSTGIGLDAMTVSNLVLDSLRLDGAGTHGINGETVTNFTLRNGSVVRNAGDADEEHGIRFRDLFGTSLIADTTIEFMEEDGIEIINDDVDNATIDVLTVSNSVIQNNNAAGFGENGMTVRAQNDGNLRVVVENTTIQGCDGDGINGAADGTDNNGFLDLRVIGSTIQNNGARAIALGTANNQDMDVHILDGTSISGNITTPVVITGNQSSTVNVTIDNTTGLPANNITITGSQNVVGGVDARCLEITADDNVSMVVSIADVAASDCDFAALRAIARDTASLDLTVQNSSFTASGDGFEEAVTIVAGVNTAGDTGRVCLNMLNNTASTGGGIFDDYRLRTRQATNVFQLQNFVGNGAVAGNVQTWVNTTKSNTGTALITISAPFTAAPANCLLPP
ncbi:MAG: hypothetical protein K8J08_21115, partial [Thermoanaerobaculia bacterium]|nr:hypothetical protein [Thermoanaerobaculia bacterium]